MTDDQNDYLMRLGRASRRAAILSGVAFVVVIASLVYASGQLSHVQKERDRLSAQADTLRAEVGGLQDSVQSLRKHLEAAQRATSAARAAINAFQSNRYVDAVALYDEALEADPGNPYVQNLRAYALFKMGHVEEAITGARKSVAADSTYAWGYFDLARFSCAAGHAQDARRAWTHAVRLRPQMRDIARHDGEFRHYCGEIVQIGG